MSASSNSIQSLNFIGFHDSPQETLILDRQQEQALLKRLLRGRNDLLYEKLYGQKNVCDIYIPPREQNVGVRADPFWK